MTEPEVDPQAPMKAPSLFFPRYLCAGPIVLPSILLFVAMAHHLQADSEEGGMLSLTGRPLLILYALSLLVGVGTAALSFRFRRRIDATAPRGYSALGKRVQSVLGVMYFASCGSVLGFLLVVLTGEFLIPLTIWGVSIAAGISHYPSKAWLLGEDVASDTTV